MVACTLAELEDTVVVALDHRTTVVVVDMTVQAVEGSL